MSQKQTKLIAKKVCEQYPNTPTLTLAKKLFAEHPEVYTDVEHARKYVRTIRGKNGTKNRKNTTDKSLYDDKPRALNPFKLPKSYAKKRQQEWLQHLYEELLDASLYTKKLIKTFNKLKFNLQEEQVKDLR